MTLGTDEDWNGVYGDPRAAEYVLGTLSAEERAAFAQAIDNDRALADSVDAWATRLSALNTAYGEIDPPAAVKAALDRRLFASAADVPVRESRWSFWPFAGGLVSGLVLATALLLAFPLAELAPSGPDPDLADNAEEMPRLVASLAPNDSEAGFVALFDAHSRQLDLTRVAGAAPREGVYEIWVLHDGADPVSLGVLPEDDVAHMVMPKAHADMMTDDATLAVSWEPEGGSPTGLPTGPVIAAGSVHRI